MVRMWGMFRRRHTTTPAAATRCAGLTVVAVLSLIGVTATVTRSAAATNTAAHISASSRWVIGYYPEYLTSMMPPKQIDWHGMTHIAVGRIVPNHDGSLNTTFDVDATHGPRIAEQLSRLAKAHHVVPILMIGGAGEQSQWEGAARHHLSRLVSNLISAMRRYGYVGLDLDWEPVPSADEPTLLKLVNALKAADPSVVLTVPVGWGNYREHVDAFYGQLAKRVQRLDIMTYGMAGAYPGWKTWHSSALHGAKPDTPADVASNVSAYEAAGVPARKLGIGVGFYGTCWTGGVNGPNQDIGSSYVKADDNVMTYVAIMAHYYQAASYHYDSTAAAPYLGYSRPTGPQGCTYISYENATSIKAKGRYAVAHHLGGAIIWAINEGHVLGAPSGHTDPLLLATRKAFQA